MTTTAVQNLLALPGPDRLAGIETLIMAEFGAALRLEPDEPLPMGTPYFELGLTSLQLVEARKRLQELLGVTISANVMFNQPTLEQLISYLARLVLPEPGPSAESAGLAGLQADVGGPGAEELALLAEVLPELDQG